MIERVYAHNYRCLQNFTLDLKGRSSALLIGKNGAGKSTVVRCLELFQSIARGSRRVGDLIKESDFTQYRTDEPMRLEVEFVIGGQRYAYAVAFEWIADLVEARIASEALTVDGERAFARDHGRIHFENGSEFGLDRRVFALPFIVETPPERHVLDARAFLSATVAIAPVPASMSGFAEAPSTELARDASNYAACLLALLQRSPRAYAAFEGYIKEVMPDFASIENRPRGERGSQLDVTFEHGSPPRTLPVGFESLSDGEKCFFLAAYLTASNRAGPPVVCVWDEPDNHLSLSQVGQFVTELRKLSNRGGQFIATTHHPETLRKFSPQNTLVLTRASHLDPAVVRPLVDFDYAGDLVDALIRDEVIG